MDIPVWHDDQQGTAASRSPALINAVKIVGKDEEDGQDRDGRRGRLEHRHLARHDRRRLPGREHHHVRLQGHPPQGPRETARTSPEKWNMCANSQRRPARRPDPRRDEGRRRAHRAVEARPRHHQAGVGRVDGQGLHRLRLRQPDSRDLAVGGQGGGRAHRRDRPLRLPEPGQQLARLPRHLPRRARRGAQAPSPTRCASRPRTSSRRAPRTRD